MNGQPETRAEWARRLLALPADTQLGSTLEDCRTGAIQRAFSDGRSAAAMAKWLAEMQFGTPGSKREILVDGRTLVESLTAVLTNHIKDAAVCKAIIKDLRTRLEETS